MVVVPSPSLPIELEQKKRKQTLERAKANHLSKQLQMRLQYAKLKVEHGWQRQNLNEVENLYFHHSHLRNMRHNAAQRSHYAVLSSAPAPPTDPLPPAPLPAVPNVIQAPAPSAVLDRTSAPSPLHQSSKSPPTANEASSSASFSPPVQSQPEQSPDADRRPSSEPSYPPVQTPLPLAPVPTKRPPSAIDVSDPSILARLAQLQAQMPSQSQTFPRQPPTSIPPSTPSSQPGPGSPQPHAVSAPLPSQPSPPFVRHPQPSVAFPPSYAPAPTASQPLLNASTPAPLYPVLSSSIAAATSTGHNTIAPSPALTYDSFWSTHASSTGPTRALYRTHAGFTASAAPGGNVAMLTPGGHAAVMTAEGVYVGGNRSG